MHHFKNFIVSLLLLLTFFGIQSLKLPSFKYIPGRMDSNNGERTTEELLALSKESRKRTRENSAAKKRENCRTFYNKKKNKKNKTSKNKWNDVHQAAGYNATGDSQDVVMDEATHQDSANDTQNDVHQATANNAANRESQDVGMVEATHQDSANNETPIHCHFFPTNAGAINGADPREFLAARQDNIFRHGENRSSPLICRGEKERQQVQLHTT